LVFICREIFQIKADENSSRTERRKKPNGSWECAPKALSPKYVTLMKQIDDFLDMW